MTEPMSEEYIIRLTPEEYDQFLYMLDRDPRILPRLRDALLDNDPFID